MRGPLAALAGLVASVATAGPVAAADAVPGADAPAAAVPTAIEPIEEITITARQPRYVERTRRDRIGRIWAPVMIDGHGPFRFVLDTGATRTAAVGRVAQALGIPLEGQPQVRLRGVTGTATVGTIPVGVVEFGDLRVPTHRLPILPDALGGADGVLGTEGLKDRRVYVDFMHDLIHVSHSRGERAPLGFVTVPFDLAGGHLLVTDARVGGVATKLIIDTGAQISVGNLALRRALSHRREGQAPQHVVQGVTLDEEQTEEHVVPEIHFGELKIATSSLEFADISIFKYWDMTSQPAVLVGMDVLGLLDRLIIDYQRRELQLRLVNDYGS